MVDAARLRRLVGFALAGLAMSCRPEMEGRPSLIEGPTLLAMRSSPAEAIPGETVAYDALFVSNDEESADLETLSWQSCLLRKPLTAAGAIHPDCLSEEGDGIVLLGSGLEAESVVDESACQLFGPTPPDSVDGGDALRAADPDTTGGFYQPVVVRQSSGDDNLYSIGVTRLSCGIGAAAQEQVIEYNQHYRRNENPLIDTVSVDEGSGATTAIRAGEAVASVTVAAGSTVHLEVAWSSCPRTGECGDGVCSVDESEEDCSVDCTTPVGCHGAETYLMFSPTSRTLIERREQLRLSWYATSGRFEHDRTAANASDRANASVNVWSAPGTAETVRFWVVLRDDRRGVGWQAFDLTVED